VPAGAAESHRYALISSRWATVERGGCRSRAPAARG